MLPARIYLFVAGAICHAFTNIASHRSGFYSKCHLFLRLLSEATACVGCMLVFYSFNNATASSPISLRSLAPAGTALLILTPEALLNRKLFGSSAAMHIGKLSYSVYLVHWPIFVFCAYASPAQGIKWLKSPIFLTIISFLFGRCMYDFVETRFRVRKSSHGQKTIVLAACVIVVMAIVSCILTSGWKFRFRGKTLSYAHLSSFCRQHNRSCLVSKSEVRTNEFNIKDVDVAVIGNSFAMHLIGAFHAVHTVGRAPFLFIYSAGCYLQALEDNSDYDLSRCLPFNKKVWGRLKLLRNQSIVIIAENFGSSSFNMSKLHRIHTVSQEVRKLGLRPLVFGAPAGVGNLSAIVRCRNINTSFRFWGIQGLLHDTDCGVTAAKSPASLRGVVDRMFSELARTDVEFSYVSTVNHMCRNGTAGAELNCPLFVEGSSSNPVYMYQNDASQHLTYQGSIAHAHVAKLALDKAGFS